MFTRCGERVGAPSPPSPCDLHTRGEKGRGGAYIMAPLVAVDHDWTNVHYWPPLSTPPRRYPVPRPSPLTPRLASTDQKQAKKRRCEEKTTSRKKRAPLSLDGVPRRAFIVHQCNLFRRSGGCNAI